MTNPVQIYRSKTAGHVPSSLLDGQLALNQADGILFYPDASGAVKSASIGSITSPTGTIADGDVAIFNGTTGKSIKSGGSFGALVTANAPSVTDLATGTSTAKPVTPKGLADFAAPLTVTYAASIALDLNTRKDFEITLTGNLTLANPTNLKAGDRGMVRLVQDATGSRTLAVGSFFTLLGAGTMSTAASSVTLLSYVVWSSTLIYYTLTKV